jgi:hypothetical protein
LQVLRRLLAFVLLALGFGFVWMYPAGFDEVAESS